MHTFASLQAQARKRRRLRRRLLAGGANHAWFAPPAGMAPCHNSRELYLLQSASLWETHFAAMLVPGVGEICR